MDARLKQKRLTMAKEAWIKNIMRVLEYSRDKAEEMYKQIKPKLD